MKGINIGIKKLVMLLIVTLVAGFLLFGEEKAIAGAPVGVDAVIGAEWDGVTPILVPFPSESQLVDYNVYVRNDDDFCYIGLEALPADADQWNVAVGAGLCFGGNLQIDTEPATPNIDLNINPLGGFLFDFAYGGPGLANEADADLAGLVKEQACGTGSGGDPPSVGGVQEIAIPFSVLETDPDNIGFPVLTSSNPCITLRRTQAFGNTFATNGGTFDFGSCCDPKFDVKEHFLCYEVDDKTKVDIPPLSLLDQFGLKENVKALKAHMICAPVDKNGEGIIDPDVHYVCYNIVSRKSLKKNVLVNNQFGEQELRVLGPRTLCVPSTKEVIE